MLDSVVEYVIKTTFDFTSSPEHCTKNEVSNKDFFSKCDQIHTMVHMPHIKWWLVNHILFSKNKNCEKLWKN